MKKKFECADCGKKFGFKDELDLHADARHQKADLRKRIAVAKKSVLIYASLTAILLTILAIAEYTK
ncbi:MAG: hypothetical protein HY516_05360 [Candidatus Aenigmarchaeota archaeon]|nr:hypothetical protein [Candidatus Aenigmarchaeota archaeon]